MSEMRSNAKKVPASSASIKSRGMKTAGKEKIGASKKADMNVSKKLNETFKK